MFFHESVFFDESRRPYFDKKITKVEIGPGIWKSEDSDYNFYSEFDTIFEKKIVVDSIQNIIVNSKPLKTKMSSTKEWVNFSFYGKNEVFVELTLKKNYDGEVFFEFTGNKFEGKQLENYLISKVSK
jgi:DNA-directed RNA polymerase alpha subunit